MSRLTVKNTRNKLSKFLSRAEDEAFCRLVWATDALQSGRVAAASKQIQFPIAAATSEFTSEFAVRKWELESILTLLLTTPKNPSGVHKSAAVRCDSFGSIASACNLLRKLEDDESELYLRSLSIRAEMHRIGHRQFPWQRRFATLPQFFRYAFIYGQGNCASYFLDKNHISVSDFALLGFVYFSALERIPVVHRSYSFDAIGLSEDKVQAGLRLLHQPIEKARRTANAVIASTQAKHPTLPTAYLPSPLRNFPLVSFGSRGDRIYGPLRELIVQRVTAGVYYDLVGGPSDLRNEAAAKFEAYCERLLRGLLKGTATSGDFSYFIGRNEVKSPDLHVNCNGVTELVLGSGLITSS